MGGSVYDKSLEVEIELLSDDEEVCTLPLVREDTINDEAIARAIAEDEEAGRTAEKLSEMKASTSFDAYDEGVAEATQRSIDSGKREAEERAFDEQRRHELGCGCAFTHNGTSFICWFFVQMEEEAEAEAETAKCMMPSEKKPPTFDRNNQEDTQGSCDAKNRRRQRRRWRLRHGR